MKIDHYKKLAKALKRDLQADDPAAAERCARVYPRKDLSEIGLMNCQHVIAVEAGFTKWGALKAACDAETAS